MTKLSPTQIYQLAQQAGFSGPDAVNATAIALAESGGDTSVVNSIGAMGLFQIYDGSYPNAARVQAMSDPLANAQAAFAKFKASQGSSCGGWWPWASYDEGPCAARNEANRNNSWRTFLGMAQAAATGTDIAQGGGSLVVPAQDGTDSSAATVVASGGASSSASSSSSSSTLSLGSILGQPVEIHTGLLWSFLFIGGAIALFSIGVYLIFRQQINAAAGRAAEVAAIAA